MSIPGIILSKQLSRASDSHPRKKISCYCTRKSEHLFIKKITKRGSAFICQDISEFKYLIVMINSLVMFNNLLKNQTYQIQKAILEIIPTINLCQSRMSLDLPKVKLDPLFLHCYQPKMICNVLKPLTSNE